MDESLDRPADEHESTRERSLSGGLKKLLGRLTGRSDDAPPAATAGGASPIDDAIETTPDTGSGRGADVDLDWVFETEPDLPARVREQLTGAID